MRCVEDDATQVMIHSLFVLSLFQFMATLCFCKLNFRITYFLINYSNIKQQIYLYLHCIYSAENHNILMLYLYS